MTAAVLATDITNHTGMISTLDFLYIVLALCSIAITVMLVLLGSEWLRISADVRRVSQNVEQIAILIQKISRIAFPGIELAAKGVDSMGKSVGDVEERVARYITKKVTKLTKE